VWTIPLLVALGLCILAALAGVRSLLFTRSLRKSLKNLQFTVYRPAAIGPHRWYPLLAFAHRSTPRSDKPDAKDPVGEARQQAARLLHTPANEYQPSTVSSRHAIPRGGELTFVPDVPGIEFSPDRYSFRPKQSVHRKEFNLRATIDPVAEPPRGRLTVLWGSLIVGDVPLTIPVADVPMMAAVPEPGSAYQKIFASYSHEDTAIVQQFEKFVKTLGDRYLRDVRDLRAGQVWNEALKSLIERAEIFQLFWSTNALTSALVRAEWEFALTLNRPEFIRPVYWEEPLPALAGLPPEPLRTLHFYRLQTPGLPAESVVDLRKPAPSLWRSLLAPRLAQGAVAAFVCGALLWQLNSYSSVVTLDSPVGEPSETPNPSSPIPAHPSGLETPAPSSPAPVNPSPDTPASSSPVPANRRLVYEMVLSEAQGNFSVGKVDLPNLAKQRIDRMVTKLKADPQGMFIEIEGHTDDVGSTLSNSKLAKARAEAVKRYLHESHEVPLARINAISYGEEKPVAPNNTRQGRAKNRRIVIKVLA
jgi:outer membrane protein OmpA-like peptidoglycan-associated protein